MSSNYPLPSGNMGINIFQSINSTENFSRLTQLIAMFISVWLAAAGIGEKKFGFIILLSVGK